MRKLQRDIDAASSAKASAEKKVKQLDAALEQVRARARSLACMHASLIIIIHACILE